MATFLFYLIDNSYSYDKVGLETYKRKIMNQFQMATLISALLVVVMFIILLIVSKLHFHKFGEVKSDGLQYCSECGKAEKPAAAHPCSNGHVWLEVAEIKYEGGNISRGYSWTDYRVASRCKNCGENKTDWRFGH
jgi:hypothetical protein